MCASLVEKYPALESIPEIRHGFVVRVPDLDVRVERAEALNRLETIHAEIRSQFGNRFYHRAEQVHGCIVVPVAGEKPGRSEGSDGLITNDPRVLLGIYVADCCAIFLVDPVHHAIGLVHSGRVGSELNIVGEAVERMKVEFGTEPGDIVAQLSPCIRPPLYEVDFAGAIKGQLAEKGVREVHDSGANTGADLEKYYSYRMEKGRTGRMLALLTLR